MTAVALAVAVMATGVAPAAATTLPTGFQEDTLTTPGLAAPVAVAFAPDGRKFVAEKAGRAFAGSESAGSSGGDASRYVGSGRPQRARCQ